MSNRQFTLREPDCVAGPLKVYVDAHEYKGGKKFTPAPHQHYFVAVDIGTNPAGFDVRKDEAYNLQRHMEEKLEAAGYKHTGNFRFDYMAQEIVSVFDRVDRNGAAIKEKDLVDAVKNATAEFSQETFPAATKIAAASGTIPTR